MPRLIASAEDPTEITVPPLAIGPFRSGIGHIVHVLQPASLQAVIDVTEIPISTRTKERLYTLSNGEKILVTGRRKLERPEGVDGILRQIPTGYSWISHKRLDVLQADIDARGLKAVAKEIAANWRGKFSFQAEERDEDGNITATGLRPPQISARLGRL